MESLGSGLCECRHQLTVPLALALSLLLSLVSCTEQIGSFAFPGQQTLGRDPHLLWCTHSHTLSFWTDRFLSPRLPVPPPFISQFFIYHIWLRNSSTYGSHCLSPRRPYCYRQQLMSLFEPCEIRHGCCCLFAESFAETSVWQTRISLCVWNTHSQKR